MRIGRALRYMGYVLLVAVGEPLLVNRPATFSSAMWGWTCAYAVFGLAFHVSASATESQRRRRLGAIAVLVPATFVMAALLPCQFGSMSLLLVASQAALVLTRGQTAALIAVQTSVLACLLVQGFGYEDGIGTVIALLSAESFAAVAVHLARREAEALRELAQANAELRATRSLLEETSRAHERTRIARELHDVLGHDLTALGLQLEVATHVDPRKAGTHVVKAQEVSARLLRNVRDVVTTMRDAPGPDLASALRTLVDGVPGLTVHLEMPCALHLDDGARAQCILRCVQEIVTNALKHSRAANLWVTITHVDGTITLDARDDGRCAREVHPGHGLSGMRARLEEMGGWLKVAAEPARAFALTASMPAKEGPL